MILEQNLLAEQVKELVKCRTGVFVGEQFLLCDLAMALVEDAELELGDQDMLVIGGDEAGGLGAEDGRQGAAGQLLIHQLRNIYIRWYEWYSI